MIRKFAIVAIATVAIAGGQIGQASAAGAYDPGRGAFFLRNSNAAVDPNNPDSGNTYYVGSANGGVWKTTDGGTSWMTFDGLAGEPQALLVPAIQKPHCTSKYC